MLSVRRPGLSYPVREDWHYVGETGEPAFSGSWGNVNGRPKLAFRIRETGVVDLQGHVSHNGGSLSTIFTLPVGYRPSNGATIAAASDVGSVWLNISTLGSVIPVTVLPLHPAFLAITGQFFLNSPTLAGSGTNYARNTTSFFSYQAVTTSTALGSEAGVVAASNTITVTLPATGTIPAGQAITIKNVGAGTVTVDGDSTETIDGALTVALAPTNAVTVVSDGTNWITV